MWIEFALVFAVLLVVVYAPGFTFLFGFGYSSYHAAQLAPLVTFGAMAVITIVFPMVGIPCNGFTVVGTLLLIGLSSSLFKYADLLFCGRRANKVSRSFPVHQDAPSIKVMVFGLLVPLGISVFLFVKNLDGPDSFVQGNDAAAHLSTIRMFLDTQDYSSLLKPGDYYGSISPFLTSDATFYPSLWHALVALVPSVTDVPLTLSLNVVNLLLIAIVFPMGVLYFLSFIFGDKNEGLLICGSLVSLLFSAFPWNFLTWGPLYPNLAAMAIVPASTTVFMSSIDWPCDLRCRMKNIAVLLIGVVAMTFFHPNALFTCAVVMSPYVISRIVNFEYKSNGALKKVIGSIAFISFVVLVWIALPLLPIFSGVMGFRWAPIMTFDQAVFDSIAIAYGRRIPQYLLAILVAVGFLHCLSSSKKRWLSVSYAISLFLFIVSVAFDGDLKTLLVGYWYGDRARLAATAAVAGIPLAASGLCLLLDRLTALLAAENSRIGECVLRSSLAFLTLVLVLYPNHKAGSFDIQTGFGYFTERFESDNDVNGRISYPKAEQDFVERVSELIPADSRIINVPYDGSVYSYAINGTNTLYRHSSLGAIDSPELAIIKAGLADYAFDEDVQEAVGKIGAEYVLLLDCGSYDERPLSVTKNMYDTSEWVGITSISDFTEGFQLVASEGDMRLYEISTD